MNFLVKKFTILIKIDSIVKRVSEKYCLNNISIVVCILYLMDSKSHSLLAV